LQFIFNTLENKYKGILMTFIKETMEQRIILSKKS
jgi:hypothetical protein